jgi:hypothetical protein
VLMSPIGNRPAPATPHAEMSAPPTEVVNSSS